MAKTAELDTELVNGLKLAKTKRAYFAMIVKGGNDGALIISKTKVPPPAIAAAKKQCGGSAVLKGFCLYEEGRHIFETAKEAPATAANAVKIIAKRDAGMTVHAEFRISTDPELLADLGDAADDPTATSAVNANPEAAAVTASPTPDGLAVVKRFHALSADIQAALSGPNNDRIKTLSAAIREQLVKKEFADAANNIDALEPLLKPAPISAATKVDGLAVVKRFHAMTADIQTALGGPNSDRIKALNAAIRDQLVKKDFTAVSKNIDELEPLLKPGKDGAPQQPDGAAVMKRLSAMTPDVKIALAGPNKAQVQTLFLAAGGLIKNKDFVQANQVLDELAPLVDPSQAADDSNLAAEFKQKLGFWLPDIKAVIDANGPNAAELRKLLTQALALSKAGGDMAQALAQLTECHNLATSPAPASDSEVFAFDESDGEERNETISPTFAASWKEATDDWRDAVDTVSGQLESLRSTLFQLNEADHPNIAHLIPGLKQIASGGLSKFLNGQRVAMQVAISNVDQATDDVAKAKFISAAHKVVNEVLAYVEDDEEVEVCDENGFGVEVTIRSQLGGALSGLDETLAAALVD